MKIIRNKYTDLFVFQLFTPRQIGDETIFATKAKETIMSTNET